MNNQILERRNFYSLNDDEKKKFIDVIVRLKITGIYDKYVIWHAQTMSVMTTQPGERTGRNAAHRGPIFLPWHREYLRRFEKDLQMPMPYWKWEDEADPDKARIWNWLGGNGDPNEIVRNFDTGQILGYRVKEGPCAYENGWETIEANQAGESGTTRFSNGEKIKSHNRNDPMIPWDSPNIPKEERPTIERVLNHRMLGYKYATETLQK